MKNTTRSRLTKCFVPIVFFIVGTVSVFAQQIDADVPTGFAVVEGDGLSTTTGGGNGQVVTAANYTDLKSYCGSANPLIILVEGAITGSGNITIKSNKSIIGKGTTAQISGFGLDMNTVSNIIIRNLKINGAVDGIAARATHHLWVDHCEIWDCTDGLLDITVASSYCTVSWCKFYYVNQVDHRLACLIGNGGGTAPGDWGRNKVTYHHNWYGTKADQRMPRLMYGEGHIYNDYYSCAGNSYCIGVGSYAAALIENNYFKGVKNPHQFMYDVFCHITANGNSYENSTGTKDMGLGGTRKETGQDFDVKPFTVTPYMYWMDDAIDIPTVVVAGASPKTAYSEIGLMPTPGQGAVNVKINASLSWKNGTVATPLSYKVYFGTTEAPTQVATVTTQSYAPGSLTSGTLYYWRIDAVTALGTIEGKLWAFKTEEIAQNVSVTGVTISPSTQSIGVGMTTALTASISPSNATNKAVTWNSGNASIATVNAAGLVTGVAIGTTTIEAKTVDGDKTAVCTIDVVEKPSIVPMIKIDFNENAGTNVSNTGSVSATLTKSDVPSWSTNTPVNGGVSSIDFGSTNGNYYVESNAVLSQLGGLTEFTVTGWVNCSSAAVGAGGNRIVSWINNGANGVDVVYVADGSLKVGINQWPDNTTAISSTGKITANAGAPAANWKFFAVTYRSVDGQIQFYFGDNSNLATLDKSLIYSKGVVGTNIGNLSIGHFNTQSLRTSRTDRMFKGLIDQVQIYGSALTLGEIQGIQNILGASIDKTNETPIVNVFPNPVTGLLNIACNKELTKNAIVEVLEVTGKSIVTFPAIGLNQTLDVSGLSKGIYLVKVSDSGFNKMMRIIKQ